MSKHTEHSLDQELRAVESKLSGLLPHTLPSDLIARMEKELEPWSVLEEGVDERESVCLVDGNLNELEIHLTQMSPSAMPDDMIARMSAAMDRWQDQEQTVEKVVSFQKSRRKKPRVFSGGMLSAAAAVAVLGAVAALAWPQMSSGQKGGVVASENGVPTVSHEVNQPSATPAMNTSNVQAVNYTSDNFTHKVTSTRDKGVIFSNDHIPHRCIRVDYIDRIKTKDANGREIEIKTPGVDFMLIPVETN